MRELWRKYQVELEFFAPFAASLPRTLPEIRGMLEHRMPSEAAFQQMDNPTPIEILEEQVAQEVEASDQRGERGWATFKRNKEGIYYEARCVRAHLKDCALQVAPATGVRALKAKVANRVYVEPAALRLFRPDGSPIQEVDGTETRMIHVFTRRGPRNDIKRIDFVAPPSRLAFTLRVLENDEVDDQVLQVIFEYGAVHGMGQERSQDFGKYRVVSFHQV